MYSLKYTTIDMDRMLLSLPLFNQRKNRGQVEQCANGAVYCQIIDACHPGVSWRPYCRKTTVGGKSRTCSVAKYGVWFWISCFISPRLKHMFFLIGRDDGLHPEPMNIFHSTEDFSLVTTMEFSRNGRSPFHGSIHAWFMMKKTLTWMIWSSYSYFRKPPCTMVWHVLTRHLCHHLLCVWTIITNPSFFRFRAYPVGVFTLYIRRHWNDGEWM